MVGSALSTRSRFVEIDMLWDVHGLTGEPEMLCSQLVAPEAELERVLFVSVLGR